MLFFRRRERQNLRELKKEDFSICTDSSGVRFVCKVKRVKDERSLFVQYCRLKNMSLVLTRRMITCFKDPRRQSDEVWYNNMVVGQCTLGDKMKKLSIEAKLSCMYTNHSIKETTITILDECSYEARHIMALSGHQSESSIRSYASQTSLSMKRKMSETLSE